MPSDMVLNRECRRGKKGERGRHSLSRPVLAIRKKRACFFLLSQLSQVPEKGKKGGRTRSLRSDRGEEKGGVVVHPLTAPKLKEGRGKETSTNKKGEKEKGKDVDRFVLGIEKKRGKKRQIAFAVERAGKEKKRGNIAKARPQKTREGRRRFFDSLRHRPRAEKKKKGGRKARSSHSDDIAKLRGGTIDLGMKGRERKERGT